MNIYFPNVGRRCELVDAFARALPAISPGLIWGSDPNHLAPALAVVDRCVDLPTEIDSNLFLFELGKFLVRESIELVIPTIDPDLDRLDRWREELKKTAPRARILISPSSVIRIARDKRLSREAFAKLGAEVPESIDHSDPNIEFPLFIKPASGSASIGAVRVNDANEMSSVLAKTINPMVERLIGGDETTVDILLDMKGRAMCAVPRRRLQTRSGEVTRGVVERSAELESLAMAITEGLGCIGPVTMQFRNPAQGRWVAMELNARMGGGLPLTIGAGANWPRWILQMAAGHESSMSITSALDGTVMTRADRSIILPPKGQFVTRGIKSSLPQVIVFDMDDTLYPEIDFVRSGHRAVAERVWQDFAIDIEPELRKRFESGQRGDLFSTALLALGITFTDDYVFSQLVSVYRNHRPTIQTYVETRPVLTELRSRGHKLALLSDGWAKVQRRKLEALNLVDLFDEIVFTDEIGRNAWKPSTEGFKRILTAMDISGDQAMYVADNPLKDFHGPFSLGMQSVRIRRPLTEHFGSFAPSQAHQPDRLISSLVELLDKPIC